MDPPREPDEVEEAEEEIVEEEEEEEEEEYQEDSSEDEVIDVRVAKSLNLDIFADLSQSVSQKPANRSMLFKRSSLAISDNAVSRFRATAMGIRSMIAYDMLLNRDAYLEDKMKVAVETNNVDAMVKLLNDGLDPNVRLYGEYTALHIAAEREFVTLGVVLLACKGVDVNVKSAHSYTPLHESCRFGKRRFMKLLLKNGADVNAQDRFGCTPLHLVAKNNNILMAAYLIKSGADMNALNAFKNTPLAIAVLDTKSYDFARLLLRKGASIDAAVEDNLHLFLQCCLMCNSEEDVGMVRLLNKFGASVKMVDLKTRKTALHIAAAGNNHLLASYLLKNGADVTTQDSMKKTPMDTAVQHRSWEVAYLLDNPHFFSKDRLKNVHFGSESRTSIA